MSAVQKHVVQSVQGGPGGDDPAGKSRPGQYGDPSGMVNVRMGQNHAGNLCRINKKLPVFFIAVLSPALEHTAVHEYLIFPCIQKVHGARDLTGSTQKLTFHIHPFCDWFFASASAQQLYCAAVCHTAANGGKTFQKPSRQVCPAWCRPPVLQERY